MSEIWDAPKHWYIGHFVTEGGAPVSGMWWDDFLQAGYELLDQPTRAVDAPVALRGDRCAVCGIAIRRCADTGEALRWGYGTLGMSFTDGSWDVHTESPPTPHRPRRTVELSDISPEMSRKISPPVEFPESRTCTCEDPIGCPYA